jgi:hypothetical protein
MSSAEAAAVILSGTVPLLVALAGLLWWAYRRGEVSGAEKARREAVERSQAEDKAKISALERLLTETRAELAETRALLAPRQPKRKRTLRLPE